MSIRFRLTTGKNGKKYGAIVHSYRDNDGVVRTKSLKSYGCIDDEILKSQDFNNMMTKDLEYFIANIQGGKKVVSTSSHSIFKSYYFGVYIYAYLWQALGYEMIFNKIEKKLSFPQLSESLLELTISRLIDNLTLFKEHDFKDKYIYDFANLNRRAYYDLITILNSKYAFITKNILKNLTNHGHILSKKAAVRSIYLTKFNFIHTDELSGKTYEHSVTMAKSFDAGNFPIDYEIFQVNINKNNILDYILNRVPSEESQRKLTVIADTTICNKKDLYTLYQSKVDYVLIRNMYKLPTRVQNFFLNNQNNWTNVVNKQGRFIFRYKELYIPLRFKQEPDENGEIKTDKLNIRFFVICSIGRRSHDLDRLETQWDITGEMVRVQDLGNVSYSNSGNTIAKLIRKTSNKQKGMELKFSAYKQRAMMAGYYLFATSLEDSVSDIFEIVKHHWKMKENFRVLHPIRGTGPKLCSFKEEIAGHFMMCHIANTLNNTLQKLLKRQGLNLSFKQIKDALNSCLLTPVQKDNMLWLIKSTLSAVDDQELLLDKICSALQVPIIGAIETRDSFLQKLPDNLHLNKNSI